MTTPDEIRALVLAESLARLEVERLTLSTTPQPTTAEVLARRKAGLDTYGHQRPLHTMYDESYRPRALRAVQ